jgi:hypothetical protein
LGQSKINFKVKLILAVKKPVMKLNNWGQSKINSNLVLLPTQKAAREKSVVSEHGLRVGWVEASLQPTISLEKTRTCKKFSRLSSVIIADFSLFL